MKQKKRNPKPCQNALFKFYTVATPPFHSQKNAATAVPVQGVFTDTHIFKNPGIQQNKEIIFWRV